LAREGKRASAREPGLPIQMALGGESTLLQQGPYQGKMNFLDNQVDPDTGTIRARAVFANPSNNLTPGLFVRLRLPGTAAYGGALVRDAAIGTDLDKRYVLIVNKEHTIEYRPVTLGPNLNGLRVVRSGLAAGEVIVVNGLQRVRPGAKVDPVVAPMDPPADASAAAPAEAASAAGK
jgi:multidrug efflux system membrane fusion protein